MTTEEKDLLYTWETTKVYLIMSYPNGVPFGFITSSPRIIYTMRLYLERSSLSTQQELELRLVAGRIRVAVIDRRS